MLSLFFIPFVGVEVIMKNNLKTTTNKKYVLKNKRRFFSFLFMTSLIAFTIIYTATVSGYKEPEYQKVFVEAGDTLWSIAERYNNNGNMREFIYSIEKINNIDAGRLYANTTIFVPITN